ncbi:MAG: DUF2029 domain-containing protein [Chloroflexi bacterium]|nr:DUF2029 domain-containing protein [Chloroflexota bacterium]
MSADPTTVPAPPGRSAASPGSASLRRDLLVYVAGNGLALLTGLIAAYLALMGGGHISSLTIRTGDFIQYYSISQLILGGHGGAIYDFLRLSHVEARLVYPLTLQNGVLPYLYPPYFALIVAPLAKLPYSAAYLIWLLVNCAVLLATLFALERCGLLGRRAATAARLASICSLPVVMTLALGQVSILICALLTLSYCASRNGREELAGVALALALIKPPYVLPVLVVLVAQRRWRSPAAFALTCVVLLAAPIPLLGASIDTIYAHLLAAVTGWQGQATGVAYHHVMIAEATYDPHLNNSFAGLSQLLLSGAGSKVVFYGLSAAALAALAWCAWRSAGIDLPFALSVVVATLNKPHVLTHDLTLLLIPVWVALRYRSSGPSRLGWLLAACYAAVTVSDPLSHATPLQVSVLAIVALGAWLLVTSWRVDTRENPQGAPPQHRARPDTPGKPASSNPLAEGAHRGRPYIETGGYSGTR